MDHMAPMAHPAPELDVVIEKQMRQPSVFHSIPEKQQIQEREWGFAARVDPTVTYEEYVYWAKIEREMEIEYNKTFQAEHGSPLMESIRNVFSKEGRQKTKADKDARLQALTHVGDEKQSDNSPSPPNSTLQVSDEEWRTASRALRTASWGQMFFLITTDILGWSGAP
jgi:hypothetical protein